MAKRFKLEYPISIYLMVLLYTFLAAFFIIDAFKSFEPMYPIIEYLLIVGLLIFIRKNTIFYKSRGSVVIHLGLGYPMLLIYGLPPIIIAYTMLLFFPNKKFENGSFFRRYFNYCNYIVSLAVAYKIYQLLMNNYYINNLTNILFIIAGAIIIFLINGFVIPLMFYLEKKEKLNKNISFNVLESNAINGIITFYLYQVLGIIGVFISALYAILFSRRSLYQVKYNHLNSELEEVENRLELIFNTIDYGIVMFNKSKKISMVNPIAEKFLETFTLEPVGKELSYFSNVFFKEINDLIEWAFVNKVNFNEKKVPFYFDNNVFYYDIYIYSSKNDQGELDGVILLFRDVTDEQLFRNQLIEADKLSRLGQIAAGKVHEIRNPLTTVRGYLQFLKQKISKGQYVDISHFDIALQELDRTNEIISSLLILSKESYQEHIEIEINSVIKEVSTLFNYLIMEKNITLKLDLEDGLYVLGIENHLKQILINLFLNAIDAVTAKGISLKSNKVVEIKTYSNQLNVFIEIIDDGIGISDENIKKLYIPFFTTKEYGTGLGLSVTHKLVKELNGKIEVVSKLDEGTKFTISLLKSDRVVIAN